MGDPATTRLPKPKTTGSDAFKAALDPLKTRAEFKDVGIGVIDFTRDHIAPDVWLHNEEKSYRIGSAGKIAILLAAMQLRRDVRRILGMSPQIVSTAAELDELFRNPKLWAKAKHLGKWRAQIASSAPLVKDIFDFANHSADFKGPDPNSRKDSDDKPVAAVQDAIYNKLPPPAPGETLREGSWAHWTDFTFSERLWLTGCVSDNVAATSCLSEIGIPYVKAVQQCYGLADHPDGGMHLFLSDGYKAITEKSKSSDATPPRPLTGSEPITVEDYWWSSKTGKYSDKSSHEPGSAAALTAYMIALMTDRLVDDGSVRLGEIGCTTIRKNLADGGPYDVDHKLVDDAHPDGTHLGIVSVPNTKITRQIEKIGLLQKSKDGAKAFLRCEFTYVETKQEPAPAAGRTTMKYAIVATGVIADSDTTHGTNAATKSVRLGAAVHKALLTLPRP
jgi:hypothetical protein